jgi:hypothetical protein
VAPADAAAPAPAEPADDAPRPTVDTPGMLGA